MIQYSMLAFRSISDNRIALSDRDEIHDVIVEAINQALQSRPSASIMQGQLCGISHAGKSLGCGMAIELNK